MSEDEKAKGHDIQADGVTVWVHTAEGTVARFGKNGIDVHRVGEAAQRLGVCLSCTHEPTTLEDWERFKEEVRVAYGIEVPDKYRPKRFGGPR